jgi:hypothetical protein
MNRREFIGAAGLAGLVSSFLSKAVAQSSLDDLGGADTSWDSLLNDCRIQLFVDRKFNWFRFDSEGRLIGNTRLPMRDSLL